jgi:hypothetical protein
MLKKFYYVPFSSNIKWPRLPEFKASEFVGVSTSTIFQHGQNAVEEIYLRALSGEQAAIKILHWLAVEATNDLHSLIRKHPEYVRKRACWWSVLPVLASPKHENAEPIKKLMKSVGLGSKLGRAFRTRSRINFDLPVTKYAEALKETIEVNQALILLSESNPEIARIVRYCKEVSAWPQWIHALKKLPNLHDLLSKQGKTASSQFADFWKVGKQALLEIHPQPQHIKEFEPVLARMAQFLTKAQQRARILLQIKQSFMSILNASIVK